MTNSSTIIDIPLNPKFDFLDSMSSYAVSTAYKTVSELELWDFFRTYSPEEGKGFMFSKHANLDLVSNKVEKDYNVGHSGGSWGWTMRQIQYIATNGFSSYKQNICSTN